LLANPNNTQQIGLIYLLYCFDGIVFGSCK